MCFGGYNESIVKFCYLLIVLFTFFVIIKKDVTERQINTMDSTIMTGDKEEVLVNQQATLLDDLTTRLSHVQIELGNKNVTIRDQEAINIVKNHALAGSAMGLVPLPLFDLVALSGTQYNMIEQLCQHYDVDFDRQKVKTILLAVLAGSSPTLALFSMSSGLKFIPGVGTLAGNASLTLLGGVMTYAIGQSFSKHFSAGGTLDDVNSQQLRALFRKELTRGKQLLRQQMRKKDSRINQE